MTMGCLMSVHGIAFTIISCHSHKCLNPDTILSFGSIPGNRTLQKYDRIFFASFDIPEILRLRFQIEANPSAGIRDDGEGISGSSQHFMTLHWWCGWKLMRLIGDDV